MFTALVAVGGNAPPSLHKIRDNCNVETAPTAATAHVLMLHLLFTAPSRTPPPPRAPGGNLAVRLEGAAEH